MPSGLDPLGTMTLRNNHYRKEFAITSNAGNEFVIRIRRAALNPFDFSVILGYRPQYLHDVLRLRRYNGKSHHHTNILEGGPRFYGFHIHTATERYQRSPGLEEDAFAEITSRYESLESAIRCLIDDCGFRPPMDKSPLFLGQEI